MHTTQTFKIWKSTLKKLRMLYAITGDSMVSIVDRLVGEELERLSTPVFECVVSSPSNADSQQQPHTLDDGYITMASGSAILGDGTILTDELGVYHPCIHHSSQ